MSQKSMARRSVWPMNPRSVDQMFFCFDRLELTKTLYLSRVEVAEAEGAEARVASPSPSLDMP